jgi:asparagine synthase (glutamine-hydrolysing)
MRRPWDYHRQVYLYNLQAYNLWHEDRTAAGNGIENRVPFLDHRIVEYISGIPLSKHGELFWDKMILRAAFLGELPDELRLRRKVPFFFGRDLRDTNRMMYDIITAEERALVREAFGEEGSPHSVVDRRAIDRIIASIPRDPEYKRVDELLYLINGGLLEKMAKNGAGAGEKPQAREALPSIEFDNWERESANVALQFATRRASIDIERPLTFAPRTVLVTQDHVRASGKISYLMMDNRLKYVLKEKDVGAWLQILRRIDGKRSLKDLLEETGESESSIRKHLEEALDYGIVALR